MGARRWRLGGSGCAHTRRHLHELEAVVADGHHLAPARYHAAELAAVVRLRARLLREHAKLDDATQSEAALQTKLAAAAQSEAALRAQLDDTAQSEAALRAQLAAATAPQPPKCWPIEDFFWEGAINRAW